MKWWTEDMRSNDVSNTRKKRIVILVIATNKKKAACSGSVSVTPFNVYFDISTEVKACCTAELT